ncbi:MAG: SxtJ family membrane protein [Nitrospinota bacterium]
MKDFFKRIYNGWMLFAKALGWVNTRILLSLMYFVVFTPFRIINIVIGKDLLDRKIERDRDSYWQERDIKPFKKELYKRQF